MLKIKNAVIRIEKIFDELISRLDTTEERISNLKDAAIESSKTKQERDKEQEKQNEISKDCEKTEKGVAYIYQKYQKEEKRKEPKEYLKQQGPRISPNSCQTSSQFQESQKTARRINAKTSKVHFGIMLLKYKKKKK